MRGGRGTFLLLSIPFLSIFFSFFSRASSGRTDFGNKSAIKRPTDSPTFLPQSPLSSSPFPVIFLPPRTHSRASLFMFIHRHAFPPPLSLLSFCLSLLLPPPPHHLSSFSEEVTSVGTKRAAVRNQRRNIRGTDALRYPAGGWDIGQQLHVHHQASRPPLRREKSSRQVV